jgi:hypothetical protein
MRPLRQRLFADALPNEILISGVDQSLTTDKITLHGFAE